MKVEKCRARECRAQVVWLKTAKGGAMPVDVETVTEGDESFDPSRHRSHFATCPAAERFRKR